MHLLYALWWIQSPLRACCVSATLKKKKKEAPTEALRDGAIWSVQRQMCLALRNNRKVKPAQCNKSGPSLLLCQSVILFFVFFLNRSVYLGANQSVEPLDRLPVPDDAVHSVYIEHDLAQS